MLSDTGSHAISTWGKSRTTPSHTMSHTLAYRVCHTISSISCHTLSDLSHGLHPTSPSHALCHTRCIMLLRCHMESLMQSNTRPFTSSHRRPLTISCAKWLRNESGESNQRICGGSKPATR